MKYDKLNTSVVFTCCFSETTQILMADNTQKYITEIKIGDHIASINGETKEVGCDTQCQVEEYMILKTNQGHEIAITGEHPVLTDTGWKQVMTLVPGDKVACQDNPDGSYWYEEIISLELKKENKEMYNLICDDCAIIANGIVCGDFHVQYKMVMQNRFRRTKTN